METSIIKRTTVILGPEDLFALVRQHMTSIGFNVANISWSFDGNDRPIASVNMCEEKVDLITGKPKP
jgi:hypothetical protein